MDEWKMKEKKNCLELIFIIEFVLILTPCGDLLFCSSGGSSIGWSSSILVWWISWLWHWLVDDGIDCLPIFVEVTKNSSHVDSISSWWRTVPKHLGNSVVLICLPLILVDHLFSLHSQLIFHLLFHLSVQVFEAMFELIFREGVLLCLAHSEETLSELLDLLISGWWSVSWICTCRDSIISCRGSIITCGFSIISWAWPCAGSINIKYPSTRARSCCWFWVIYWWASGGCWLIDSDSGGGSEKGNKGKFHFVF